MKLPDALWKVGIHFLMELPVPLKTLSKGSHPLSAPVLAPEAGHLDAAVHGLFQKSEGSLGSALDSDDETVVNPVGKLRLTPEKFALLFQKLYKCSRRLDADGGRNLPDLELVEVLICEIKIRVSRGIHVQIIVSAGHKRGLGEIGVVIVASRLVLHVGAPGHVGGLVPSHAGL